MPAETPLFKLPYPLPTDAVVDYPSVGRDLAETAEALIGQVTRPPTIHVLAASGNFETPAGAIALDVEAWGAGGAGGGCSNPGASAAAAGGGGGAGAYARRLIANPDAAAAVVIGAGGAGVQAGAGTPGGETTFGAVVKAAGGKGGNNSVGGPPVALGAQGGAGGLASDGLGDLIIAGETGGRGIVVRTSEGLGGEGGSAPRGGPGAPALQNSGGSNGPAGQAPGGAGGGANNVANGAARSGGPGAPGLVVVTVYYGAE